MPEIESYETTISINGQKLKLTCDDYYSEEELRQKIEKTKDNAQIPGIKQIEIQ